MARSVKTWLREQNQLIKDKSIEELSSEFCFRDPLRPILNNPEIIFSPADGVVVDCTDIKSCDDTIYGKYGDITINDLSYGMIPEGEYSVVTIFLTFYDAHIVRMPIGGVVKKTELPPVYVENRPMLDFENFIMGGKYTEIRKEIISSFAYNQRTLYSIKNPFRKDSLYLILTADYDIDTILDFSSKMCSMVQNQRLASIRYGSMVTCIVPKSWNTELKCKENTHVEAGLDTLFFYE